jgi:L-cystine transport system permease protein
MRAFHWDIFIEFYVKILPYLSVTFTYVFFSLLFGFVFGVLIVSMRLSRYKILQKIAAGYVTMMRCVPSIVLLFLIYYGLPMFLKAALKVEMKDTSTIVYVIVTFSMLLGASTSELLRAAYLSVDKGQREAAAMAGLSGWDSFRRIVFPQAFYAAIPNIGNIVIYMMKEGALAYTIGLHDVLGQGYYLNGLKANAYAMETYIALALIYWPCTIILEQVFAWVERHFSITRMIARNNSRREKQIKAGGIS